MGDHYVKNPVEGIHASDPVVVEGAAGINKIDVNNKPPVSDVKYRLTASVLEDVVKLRRSMAAEGFSEEIVTQYDQDIKEIILNETDPRLQELGQKALLEMKKPPFHVHEIKPEDRPFALSYALTLPFLRSEGHEPYKR